MHTAEERRTSPTAAPVRSGPILIAFDGTPSSLHALEEAAALLPARTTLVVTVWKAGLGYREQRTGKGTELHDPAGAGPVVWFQPMTEPRPERNRIHLDVYVAGGTAACEQRVADAVAAGGRLVTDEFAPHWWVLADAEGNELCVCQD